MNICVSKRINKADFYFPDCSQQELNRACPSPLEKGWDEAKLFIAGCFPNIFQVDRATEGIYILSFLVIHNQLRIHLNMII